MNIKHKPTKHTPGERLGILRRVAKEQDDETCRALLDLYEEVGLMRAAIELGLVTAHPQESNQPREQPPQGQRPGGHKQEDEHNDER